MMIMREIESSESMNCSSDIAQYLDEFKNEDQEHFIIIGLDTKNKPMFRKIVSIGTLNECSVHSRDVFKPAIVFSAAKIILAHNHPSGDFVPSAQDIGVTKRLSAGGELLGIPILDHVIISSDGYCSMRDLGMLPTAGE